MQFARPPDGFRVVVAPELEKQILSHAARWPQITWVWAGIVVRLEMTAHREGTPVLGGKGFVQVYADLPAPGTRMRVVYSIIGDCVRIHSVDFG